MGIKYMGSYDASTQISNHFTLGDLTVTQQNADNTPSDSDLTNLQQLGTVLDTLYDTIGPFNVISAYRSAAVEAALSASGQPTAESAAGKISFHTVGLAADIYPTSMSLDDFFGKMLVGIGTSDSPGPLHDLMAEVAYKPTQNTIHLAAAVNYRANNVILALNSAGTYAKLTADEITNFAQPYIQQAEAIISEAGAAVATPVGMGTIALIGAAIIGYFMLSGKKESGYMTTDLLTHAGINVVSLGIIAFFVKRLVKGNDKQHATTAKEAKELNEKQNKLEMEIKVSLAKIEGQLSNALTSGSKVEALEKTVWALDSRISAAWKVLDQKRVSDL